MKERGIIEVLSTVLLLALVTVLSVLLYKWTTMFIEDTAKQIDVLMDELWRLINSTITEFERRYLQVTCTLGT